MNMRKVFYLFFIVFLFYGCGVNGNYKKAEEYYQKSVEASRKKNVDLAISYLEKAIEYGILKRKGEPPIIYGQLGTLYKIKGDKQKAKHYLTLSLQEFESELEFWKKRKHKEMIRETSKMIRKTKEHLNGL